MTGNDMKGGQLSSYQRLQIGKGVPENFRSSARVLRDTGVTRFVDKQIRRGNKLVYGKRNHADAAAKRIRIRRKPDDVRQPSHPRRHFNMRAAKMRGDFHED